MIKDKKNQCNFRQINAAREVLENKKRAKRAEFAKKYPKLEYETIRQWEIKHRHPERMYEIAAHKNEDAIDTAIDGILFNAKMGAMTPEELMKAVETF